MISDSWESSEPLMNLSGKMRRCSQQLKQWAHNKFHSFPRTLKVKREELASLRNHETWNSKDSRIFMLENEVEKLSSQEEVYWRQRSRADWLAWGG